MDYCGPNTDPNCQVVGVLCDDQNKLVCDTCKEYFELKDGVCSSVTWKRYPEYIRKNKLSYPNWIERNPSRIKIKIAIAILVGLILIGFIICISDILFWFAIAKDKIKKLTSK